jgi:small-conductance mechanosensitive channel
VIPNADLFTDTVVVNTAFAHRRLEYDVGIGYGDDVEHARTLMLTAMRSVEGCSPIRLRTCW